MWGRQADSPVDPTGLDRRVRSKLIDPDGARREFEVLDLRGAQVFKRHDKRPQAIAVGNDEHVSAHDRRLDGSEVAWHDAGDGIAKALTVRRRLGVGAAPGLDPLRPPARIGGDLVEPSEVAVVSLVERGEALGD